MKNIVKLLGIIALVAVIGFSMTACDNNGGDNDSGNSNGGNNQGGQQGGNQGGGGVTETILGDGSKILAYYDNNGTYRTELYDASGNLISVQDFRSVATVQNVNKVADEQMGDN